ncbi:MAG TPA: TonB-dependent receptor [Thermoanaerobaculia bacterium]|nr:TonB-dependent receptor [Thermoanaerobaculia bacterium]
MLLVCLPLWADGTQLGTISGRVTDQSRAAVPGASVEVVNLEKGLTRTVTTDAQGKFIFPLLQPGPYKVTISLQGFDTFVADNALVQVEKTTIINASLRVSAASETIVVPGDVPIVDKSNAAQTTILTSELAQQLPVGRSYQALALTMPGVVLPGNANTNANVHGALFTDNLYLFDGIDTTDPTTGGFGQNFAYEAIQEVSVTTSAASADYGRAVGGIINVITKSGTNEFQGSYDEVMTNDSWNAQNKGFSPTSGQSFARSKLNTLVRVHSATLGGPIWRDRAWFFGAYEWDRATSALRQTVDPKAPQDFRSVPHDHFYDVKGTWQIAPSKLVVLKASGSPTDNIVMDRQEGGINAIPRFAGDVAALNLQNQSSQSRALQYSGVALNNLAIEGGLASSKIHVDFRPFAGDTPVHQDLSTGLYYGGPSIVGFLERERRQGDISGSYYRLLWGQTHNFKIGADYQSVRSTVDQRFGGNQLFLDQSYDLAAGTTVPFQRRDYDEPIPSASRGKTIALYGLDRFQLGSHVSLNVGLRGERQTGTSDIGVQIVNTAFVSPRISGTYDFKGDGKTLALVSYGRFYQTILQQFDDQFALLPPKSGFTVFNWDPQREQYLFGVHQVIGGASVGVSNIKPTYLDEFSVGLERQNGRNFGISARAIHRQWHDLIDDVLALSPGGGNITRNFVNLQEAKRRYDALELIFNKRFANDWGAQFSYTLSRTRGNQFGAISSDLANFDGTRCRSAIDPTIGSNGTIDCGVAASTNREGDAPYDRTHVLRAYTAYHLPVKSLSVTLSPVVTFESGDTYQRQAILTVISSPGIPTGSTVTYNYDPAGTDRLPSTYQIDFAAQAIRPVGHVEVGLKGEIFNITNVQRQIQASTTTWCNAGGAVCQDVRAAYGAGTSRNAYQAPRAFRLTALVRF